jgi:hypothetical protein
MWLLKSPLSLWLIIIEFWSNNDFKSQLILGGIQEGLLELLPNASYTFLLSRLFANVIEKIKQAF